MTINKQKVVEPYIEKVIDLKENELCIIEIKNQFPQSSNVKEKTEQKDKRPTTFFQMVKGLIKKSKIIKQLYDLRKERVDSIRLILFYDVIQKENYYEDLKKAFEESFDKNDKSQLLYQFQCIYIKSSYLAAGLFNMYSNYNFLSYTNKSLSEKIDKLNEENIALKGGLNQLKEKFSMSTIEQSTNIMLKSNKLIDNNYISRKEYHNDTEKLKNQIIQSSKEIFNLKTKLTLSQKSKLEETSKLEKEIINSSKETQKVKNELIAFQKKNSEEIIKLKEDINKSSIKILELKEELFNSKNENSKEIISLKEEMNALTEENISLKEHLIKLGKQNPYFPGNNEALSQFDDKASMPKSEHLKEEKSKEKKDLNEQLSKIDIIKRVIKGISNSTLNEEEAEKKLIELLGK